jgi:hypothetical protein
MGALTMTILPRHLLATIVLPILALQAQRGAKPEPPRAGAAAAAAARFEVTEASLTDLQRAMTEGRVTSVQLLDAYLARIAAYDHAGPAINAMIRLNPRARADAAARDSEAHRKVLARQAQLRARIIAFMDSLKLDALAYPTSARKPVIVGDPQLGATCALAAQTGVPRRARRTDGSRSVT